MYFRNTQWTNKYLNIIKEKRVLEIIGNMYAEAICFQFIKEYQPRETIVYIIENYEHGIQKFA